MAKFRLDRRVLNETFAHFRNCGAGRRECQVLWTSPWATVGDIDQAVHPTHRSHAGGFELDGRWLNDFWVRLAATKRGVRVQVHTHPGDAFHSPTDDAWPMIHTPGFLSLVIPDFGMGAVGFDRAYLAELDIDGRWVEVETSEKLEVA